jgi:hypothetical protein
VSSAGAAPTGTVTFDDGGNAIGSAPLDAAGNAVLTISSLLAGHHSITASYAGDDAHGSSISPAVDELINAPAPAPTKTTTPTKTSSTSETTAVPPAISGSPLLTCASTPVALIDVVPQGRLVHITGVASTAFAGKTVQIVLTSTHKVVAVAAVKADGTFSALANLPSRRTEATARYAATVAGATSAALKLQRRSYLTRASVSAGRLTLSGKVTGPFRPGAKVTVEEISRCKTTLKIATARLSRTGTWKVTVLVSGDVSSVVFRARTSVLSGRRSSSTVSLPHPADD